jgi:hypothetical protein
VKTNGMRNQQRRKKPAWGFEKVVAERHPAAATLVSRFLLTVTPKLLSACVNWPVVACLPSPSSSMIYYERLQVLRTAAYYQAVITTTSLSSQSAPALIRSVLIEGYEVSLRVEIMPVSINQLRAVADGRQRFALLDKMLRKLHATLISCAWYRD